MDILPPEMREHFAEQSARTTDADVNASEFARFQMANRHLAAEKSMLAIQAQAIQMWSEGMPAHLILQQLKSPECPVSTAPVFKQ